MTVKDINNLSLDEVVKIALATKDNSILLLIAKSNCEYAKTFVARNVNARWDTLDALSTSPTISVREAVLEHPCTLPSTIKKLMKAQKRYA